jgi:hypothetical protein
MRGHDALSTFSELRQLMRSDTIAQDAFARSEILYDMDRAMNLLSQSVGIRLPMTDQLVASGAGAGGMGGPISAPEVQLEGGLLATIMQSAKGRKLLSRALDGLTPEHRWALIPVVLARVMQSEPDKQSDEVSFLFHFPPFSYR